MKVQLVTNPTTDGVFRIRALRMLGGNAESPEGLQADLQGDYPRVSVVRGIEDRGSERWYAYRDGRWTHPDH